jgi:hypothetical protein
MTNQESSIRISNPRIAPNRMPPMGSPVRDRGRAAASAATAASRQHASGGPGQVRSTPVVSCPLPLDQVAAGGPRDPGAGFDQAPEAQKEGSHRLRAPYGTRRSRSRPAPGRRRTHSQSRTPRVRGSPNKETRHIHAPGGGVRALMGSPPSWQLGNPPDSWPMDPWLCVPPLPVVCPLQVTSTLPPTRAAGQGSR